VCVDAIKSITIKKSVKTSRKPVVEANDCTTAQSTATIQKAGEQLAVAGTKNGDAIVRTAAAYRTYWNTVPVGPLTS
jgi:hypothetical protein